MKRLGLVLLFITSLFACRKPHEQNFAISGLEFNIVYSTSALEQSLAAVRTLDGGYVLAGSVQSVSSNPVYSDAWVLKINNQGKVIWQKRFGGSDNNCANSIASTQNGGYIIGGYTNSNNGDVAGNHGKTDGWVVKLDKDGNKEWQRTAGGSANDNVAAIAKTSDGGYIIAGQTESIDGDVSNNHGRTDAWIVKLDINGNKLWQKTLGGTGSEGANAVIETSEGDYFMTGWTNSNDGDVIGYHVGWGNVVREY